MIDHAVQVAYLAALVASLAMELVLLALVWRERDARGAPAVAAVVGCAAGWTGSALLLATSLPEAAPIWGTSRRVFSTLMSPACLWGALSFTGRLRRRPALVYSALALLFVPHLARLYVLLGPGTVLGAPFSILAFEQRGLLTYEVRVENSVFFWAFILYSYAIMAAASLMFVRWAARSGRLGVGHARTVAAVLVVGTLSNMAERAGLAPFRLELTPIGIGIAVAIASWAVLRQRLLGLVPVTRHALFDALEDGVLATSGAGCVVDLNPAMARILGTARGRAIGCAAGDVLAPAGDLASRMTAGTTGTFVELNGHRYQVRTTHHAPTDLLLFVFKDLTEALEVERAEHRRIADLRGEWLRTGPQHATSGGPEGCPVPVLGDSRCFGMRPPGRPHR